MTETKQGPCSVTGPCEDPCPSGGTTTGMHPVILPTEGPGVVVCGVRPGVGDLDG